MALNQFNFVLLRILFITGILGVIVYGKCHAEELVPIDEKEPIVKETLIEPVSLLERLQASPIQTPPEGPRPSQYAEPMVFPPIMGSKGKYPYVQMGGVFQVNSVFYSQTESNRNTQKILITSRVINLMVQASAEQD